MPGKALLYCSIAILFISSCGITKKHDSQEFCYELSGINDTLDNLTTQWHEAFDKVYLHRNFSTLQPIRVELGSFISNSRERIANIAPNSETEKIINDEVALLTAQAAIVADVYPNFEPLSELTPKETLEKNEKLLANDLVNEKAANSKVKKQLQAYAAKYGVKLK